MFLEKLYEELEHNKSNFIRDDKLQEEDLFFFILTKVQEAVEKIVEDDYRNMQLTIVHDGIPYSKGKIFEKILLCGEDIPFDNEQKDTVARTLLFLDDGGVVREPLVVQAIKNILSKKGVRPLSILGEKGLDMGRQETTKTGSKGPWSEFVFAHILLEVADKLKGAPITSHEMFENLKGTIFENYTMVVHRICLKSDGWKSGFEKDACNYVFLQLDKNLRWDLFVCLMPLITDLSPALMVIGAKLNIDISLDTFCDNIFSTIPVNGFMNVHGKVLNEDNRNFLMNMLQKNKSSLYLCVSFLYGGFPSGVQAERYWKLKDNIPETHFLIVDKQNSGMNFLPTQLKSALEVFSKSEKQIGTTKNLKHPWDCVMQYVEKC